MDGWSDGTIGEIFLFDLGGFWEIGFRYERVR